MGTYNTYDTGKIDTLVGGLQPQNTNLTTIAGLTVANDSVMQVKSGGWSIRTIAQLVVDLLASNSFIKSKIYASSTYGDKAGAMIFIGSADPTTAAPDGSIWFVTT